MKNVINILAENLKTVFYIAAAGTIITAIIKAIILAEGFGAAFKGCMQ